MARNRKTRGSGQVENRYHLSRHEDAGQLLEEASRKFEMPS